MKTDSWCRSSRWLVFRSRRADPVSLNANILDLRAFNPGLGCSTSCDGRARAPLTIRDPTLLPDRHHRLARGIFSLRQFDVKCVSIETRCIFPPLVASFEDLPLPTATIRAENTFVLKRQPAGKSVFRGIPRLVGAVFFSKTSRANGDSLVRIDSREKALLRKRSNSLA